MLRTAIGSTLRTARRLVVGVIGTTVLLVGLALIVLPGPAFIVIPVGLTILAAEFAWARRWLRIVRERSQQAYRSFTDGRGFPPAGPA